MKRRCLNPKARNKSCTHRLLEVTANVTANRRRKNHVTPLGHAKHVEIALRNYPAMQTGHDAKRRIREKAIAFETELLSQVNGEATASARALCCSAAASYAAICQISHRLCAGNLKRNDVALAEILPSLQNSLNRAFALLGVTGTPSDERSAADQAALEELLDYRKKDGTDEEEEPNRDVAATE